MTHRFRLVFDPRIGPTYQQYRNLLRWLNDKDIEYKFEPEHPGYFYPKFVILNNDEDALLFKIFFKTVDINAED